MEPLAQLQNNVHLLLQRIDELEQEVAALRQTNTEQREEVMQAHSELVETQTKYRKLLLAHAMIGGEEDRQKARNQLTSMIAQVDHALELLKQ